ncbi:MAG: nuclear transport factor 2 family protein, partial [Myxococcota bacterium]|nr:nuclear transport factor 2 family protein [Myxococcota bacterium]
NLRGAYEGLRDLGLGIDAARAAALLARALLALGRVAEAETLSHESESLAGDDLKAAIAWRGVRAEALARRGEHAEAVAFASKAVELAAATDALLDHADARLALAAALRAAGRGREADAEEGRAKELWQAKGATLLAERAAHAAAPVATPAATAAPRGAHAPRRRPVRPNFAFEEMRRAEAAVAARDARAVEALYRRDIEIIDHQFGITYGYDAIVERVRAIIEDSMDSAFAHEPLASLGDSLGLCRMRSTATGSTVHGVPVGATEVPYLLLIEADAQGSARHIEIFGEDKLGDAVVRLYERYAEGLPDGPERARAVMAARSVAAIGWSSGDPEQRLAAVLASDFVGIDHRHLGNWSLRGAAAYVEHLRALRQVADDVEFRQLDVVALGPNAQLLRVLHTGTARAGGGVYERPFLSLFVTDAEGKLARGEWFDADREAEALARFDAHSGDAAPARRRVQANEASAGIARFEAAFAAGDAAAWVAEFDTSLAVIAHPTGASYGRDGHLRSLLRLAQSRDPVLHFEPIATLGERLVLAHRRVAASGATSARYDVGAYEREEFILTEAGASGRAIAIEIFASDRLSDAVVRLYERWAAQLPEGAERACGEAIARAVAALNGPTDPDRLAATYAPDLKVVDHRLFNTWSARSAAELVAQWRAQLALSPDNAARFDEVLALDANRLARRTTYLGTGRESGGSFENHVLELFVFAADGRLARVEVFEPEQQAEMLARFDARVAGAPSARRRVRANAATASVERFVGALEARDADALPAFFDDALRVVHHPSGATYGRREMLATWRSALRAERIEFRRETLATLGDALVLSRQVTAVAGLREAHLADFGATEIHEMSLIETDTGGRWTHVELFAPDRLGDAIARLYERHAQQLPEGAARVRAEATARSVAVVAPGGF